ncbi:MAG: VWA domain-containing protein [Gemmataceae bacterium]|nr:VWA domain-containing protein [Gemmataceae bacterium]
MQVRHRLPAVFTLYMVDVFCCALGCVILLWLVNAREARRKTAAASESARQAGEARLALDSAEEELSGLRAARLLTDQDRARLKQQLVNTRQERDAVARRAASAEKQSAQARAQVAQLQSELKELKAQGAARSGERASLESRLREAEGRARELGQQLQAERAEAEKRFAGITLSGQRVVFLVDMSGSMAMRDPTVEDREKWPKACAVLTRLMESVPGLRQYQVILFSDRVFYPLGSDGRWLTYEARTTPAEVQRRLQRVAPKGETNLYAAFAEAFRYRSQGLDTIYLLSDGLPNAVEGLPPGAASMKDSEKSAYLGQHVRRTLRDTWNREMTEQPRVRINAIGFYFDSPEVGAFLWALAREHDGSFVGMSKP